MQLTITNIALFLSLFASVNALPVADVLPTTEVAVASYDNNETSGIEARQASEVVVKSCLAINFQGDCRTIPTTKGECREFGTVFSSGFEDHVSSVASDSPCTWFAERDCWGRSVSGFGFANLIDVGMNDAISSWQC